MWLDFEHEKQINGNKDEYYVLQSVIPPMTDEEIEECGFSLM